MKYHENIKILNKNTMSLFFRQNGCFWGAINYTNSATKGANYLEHIEV